MSDPGSIFDYRKKQYVAYEDENFKDRLNRAMKNVLTANSLNLKDPLSVDMTHFNRHNLPINEPTMVGKTMIFMTRPDLNFQNTMNISRIGLFNYLAQSRLGRNIMHSLMSPDAAPYIGGRHERSSNRSYGPENYNQDLYIPTEDIIRSPFIPLVSNICVGTSGSKDILIDIEETQGDYSGNKLGYAKGGDETFNTGAELTLSLHDIYRSPGMLTFLAYMTYIHYATKGLVQPRSDYIIKRVLDYSCSIYVLMLGMDHSTILRIIRYIGCFPRSLSYGAVQHSSDPNVEGLRDIEVNMYCNGYEAFNPQNFGEFNFISRSFLGAEADNGNGIKPVTPLYRHSFSGDEEVENYYHGNNFNGHPFIISDQPGVHKLVFY